MGSVRVRPESGRLFLDFRFQGIRCREQTLLPDTKANRKQVERLLSQVEQQIVDGTFDYARTFPGSPNALKFTGQPTPTSFMTPSRPATDSSAPASPAFDDFAETWFQECLPQWRPLHQESVRGVLDKYLLPGFGHRSVESIRRADILAFRAELSHMPGRNGKPLGNSRVNKVMTFLRQILNEAADRFEFARAFQGIRPLKINKTDIHPFTLEEVNQILRAVRKDYHNYMAVRFYTGLRTGEINGLRWRNVDFTNGLIYIRETLVNGKLQKGTKTYEPGDVPMLPIVREVLEDQRKTVSKGIEWVFCNREGNPIDSQNFTKRVWTPLLRYLDFEYRRPYQTRHTAATLMLASGENPEWIARVLGHSTTEMLFRVYSRFVPNLTRQDGSAMARLLASQAGVCDDDKSRDEENKNL